MISCSLTRETAVRCTSRSRRRRCCRHRYFSWSRTRSACSLMVIILWPYFISFIHLFHYYYYYLCFILLTKWYGRLAGLICPCVFLRIPVNKLFVFPHLPQDPYLYSCFFLPNSPSLYLSFLLLPVFSPRRNKLLSDRPELWIKRGQAKRDILTFSRRVILHLGKPVMSCRKTLPFPPRLFSPLLSSRFLSLSLPFLHFPSLLLFSVPSLLFCILSPRACFSSHLLLVLPLLFVSIFFLSSLSSSLLSFSLHFLFPSLNFT